MVVVAIRNKDTLSKLACVIEQENNPQAFFSSNFVYANPDDDTGTLVLSHGATAAFTDWMSTEQGEPGAMEEVGVLLHGRWCAIDKLSTYSIHVHFEDRTYFSLQITALWATRAPPACCRK